MQKQFYDARSRSFKDGKKKRDYKSVLSRFIWGKNVIWYWLKLRGKWKLKMILIFLFNCSLGCTYKNGPFRLFNSENELYKLRNK